MVVSLGDVNFDDVLASTPLWQNTAAQQRMATAGAAQAFFVSPLAVNQQSDWMAWLQQNQTLVFWVAGGLVAFTLLRPRGRR